MPERSQMTLPPNPSTHLKTDPQQGDTHPLPPTARKGLSTAFGGDRATGLLAPHEERSQREGAGCILTAEITRDPYCAAFASTLADGLLLPAFTQA